MALLITITDAGRAEIINADNTGTGPVVITEIGIGAGQYDPSKLQTALTAEIKRVNSIAGLAVAPDTIHVMIKDEGTDAYNVGEFGLYSASGTLVAVYSQEAADGWIIQKAASSTLLLAVDIILESLDAASLSFGDITFLNPPATTETPGVVQLENSLISPSTSKALTAAQGKKLQDEKAPLASPALTGLPTAPTAVAGTNTTQLATTAFVAAVKTLLDAAIALKAPLASPALTGVPTAPTAAAGTNTTQLATTAFVAAVKTLLDAAIALKAPLASPALTGVPTAPTAAAGTNTTQLANTAFVQAAIAALVDASPATLDTLNELAAALGDDPNFATTMATALGLKAPLASPALTGVPTAPTAAAGTNTTQLATTAFVAAVKTLLDTAIALKAPLASPALTGVPTAPTAAAGTKTTQLATTAFVQDAVGTGAVQFFARNTAPGGWVKANGAALSRTTYAGLFTAIGTTFGAGDGSTTFNVPDMRGEFPRGWDDARGVDAGRVFGSAQTDLFKSHAHQLTAGDNNIQTSATPNQNDTGRSGAPAGINTLEAGGSETRPRNIAFLACIKY